MKCPQCSNGWVLVLETRRRKNGAVVRRKECANLHRWTTIDLGEGEFIDRRAAPRRGPKPKERAAA
jgi:transcriptional regulator NrdR family protein